MPSPAPLRRVLVVEDDALIGMAIEDEFADQGFEVVGPMTSCQAVLDWLSRETPDCAALDVSLRDGPCTEVAKTLRDRGVPFAVYSGSRSDRAPPEFQGVPWFEKPVALADLARALAAV